jgi:heme-degrading monooxygenase HmoA
MSPGERRDAMLVEIRRYTIKPGRRDEFVRFFRAEVMPAMEAAGMRILGVYVGVEDSQTFFYLRGFDSADQRDRQLNAFYQGREWLGGMRDRALEMEESFHVELVSTTSDEAT